jgi:NitT/TauT family transport system substrate-binding protein
MAWCWTRRLLTAVAVCAAFAAEGQAPSPDKVTIGVLRFTSSGPIFLALDRGYFREVGLDAELAFFQAAPTVALGAATGDITFGVTALTAAAFNLAAEGRLKILAGQAQEKRGYSGNLILVTRQAYDDGFDRLDELFDQPFGLTQAGSPSHYQLGQLAAGHGVAARDLNIRPFQTLPNLVAALKTGAVSWAIIAPPIATDLIDTGAVVSLGRGVRWCPAR